MSTAEKSAEAPTWLELEKATLPEDSGAVVDMVEALLYELGDEGGTVDRGQLMNVLETVGERFTAFFAVDVRQGRKRVGLATVTEGFALYANGAYGCLDEFFVAKEYRSQGVGSFLIGQVLAIAKERGYSRVDVTSPADLVRHARALTFYQREGFIFTGSKLKYKF